MAIPKKGSRPITVDGSDYRWLIRRKPTYVQGNGWTPMTLAISAAFPRATSLVVTLATNRPDAWVGAEVNAITPHNVAALIRLGIARGWNPATPGGQLQMDVRVEGFRDSEVPPTQALSTNVNL
jgi:hypothetical protein